MIMKETATNADGQAGVRLLETEAAAIDAAECLDIIMLNCEPDDLSPVFRSDDS